MHKRWPARHLILNKRDRAKLDATAPDSDRKVLPQTHAARHDRRIGRVRRDHAIGIPINSAGIQLPAPLYEFVHSDRHALMQTDRDSVFFVARQVARHIIEYKQGRIINICSVRERIGYGGICGPDLDYYRQSGSGMVHIEEPMGIRCSPSCCDRQPPPPVRNPGGR